jgi:hypothetical protein
MPGDAVEWLEINHWPNSGRLMVFPSQDGPFGNREERLYFELSSEHLEKENRRVGDSLPDGKRDEAWEALNRKVWEQVGNALRIGEASRQLAEAHKEHRFRLAAYDYDFGEGLFPSHGVGRGRRACDAGGAGEVQARVWGGCLNA